MAFFDSLKETVTDLAQAGVAKSKQVAEIAKLKAANLAEEDAIKKAYVELGKLYYAERGDAPEAAYISSCERITAAKAAIETNNDRIAELKAESEHAVEVEVTVEKDDDSDKPFSVEAERVKEDETPAEEAPVEEAPTAEEAPKPDSDINLTL